MGQLENQTAIITGSGRGLGAAVAKVFSREGANVVVLDLIEENVHSTVQAIMDEGGNALGMACDVGDRAQVDAVVKATVEAFGSVDILVNNAQAANPFQMFIDHTEADIDRVVKSGFYGSVYFMQACYPIMKGKRGGKVINIGSGAGLGGQSPWSIYGAVKEGIRGLTKCVAMEWAADNINVNLIIPAAATDGFQLLRDTDPDTAAEYEKQIPLGRMGDPEQDLAPAFVFLASSASDYVTGHTLSCDGGSILHT
ncbi:MAG: SDR family NAD(P)-dependent oxidoreductase [Gammaproteobacteria bacterium]|nr:SDR family NAD(P)-dependent oxidoreductase [Gammaproteobacteria bacterium]